MAKKLSQPVKFANPKAKGTRKVMASDCANPAWKRRAKAAHSAKRATGKPAKHAVKPTRPARTPVAKQRAHTASSRSLKKPAIKRTPRALAKAKAPKPVAKKALAKVPAKPLPKANVKRAAKPQAPSGKAPAPVPGQVVKPSAGEIAAKLSFKRTEKALAKGKARSGKNDVELRKLELTPAEAEARKTRLKNLIVLGRERSYLTYAEINDHLPDDILDAEQIEGIISMINEGPDPALLAEKMEMAEEKIQMILKISKVPISIETPIGDDDLHLGDFIEDASTVAPVDAAVNASLRDVCKDVLDTLTLREAKVLRMRFGIEMNTDHTLEEVGKQFDVTRERIRQIEAKALRKLRHPSRSERLKSFLEGEG